jgi:hypothetical protein
MSARNRIKGHAEVPAASLTAHPLNWRDHPQHQAEALAQALDAIGWVKRVVVNRRTGRILDGHLRVEQAAARGETVPVVYVDLDEHEEALILASMDPIAGEAGTNTEGLGALLLDLRAEFEQLDQLLQAVADDAGIRLDSPEEGDTPPPPPTVQCPRCGHGWED